MMATSPGLHNMVLFFMLDHNSWLHSVWTYQHQSFSDIGQPSQALHYGHSVIIITEIMVVCCKYMYWTMALGSTT